MSNTRDIRRRIKAVKNTRQITKAMQLVAASKMKRAQEDAIAGRPYSTLLFEILNTLRNEEGLQKHPFFKPREVKRRGVIVVSTDKGLCGALNANTFRKIFDMEDDTVFVAIGRKAAQFLSRSRKNLIADFSVGDKITFTEIRIIVEFIESVFMEEKIDTVEILYPRFVNTLEQEPMLTPILPIYNIEEVLLQLRKRMGVGFESLAEDTREVKFEPSVDTILERLPQLYLKQEIYHMVLEAKASEHSARMVAMKSATDNANNLIEDLTLQYNKLRQAAITQEILEIAAATASNG